MSAATDSPRRSRPRRLLIVEDNPGDARLVREMLKGGGWTRQLEVDEVASLAAALDRLRDVGADCVLLDLSLPDAHGLEGLRAVEQAAPEVPVVILSGTDNEALTLEALHLGAQDYLVKGKVDGPLVARSIRYAVERKRAETELAHEAPGRANRRRYRLSSVGLALVLAALAAFSITAVSLTKISADRLEQSSSLSDAYAEALRQVELEQRWSTEHRLRLAAGDGSRASVLRAEHDRAADRLVTALDSVRLAGDGRDQARADRIDQEHRRYLEAAGGVPSGPAVVDPALSALDREIRREAGRHREEAQAQVRGLSKTEDRFFALTLMVFSLGLLLLGLFGGVIRSYHGRLEQVRHAEVARRARAAPA